MLVVFTIFVCLALEPFSVQAAGKGRGQGRGQGSGMGRGQGSGMGQGRGQSGPRGVCLEDAKRLCPDVAPGGGRMLQCLKEKQAQLSEACMEKLGVKLDTRGRRIRDKCQADIGKRCQGVTPGKGRIFRCLSRNIDTLDPACKTELQSTFQDTDGSMKACRPDRLKFCKDVSPGQGRILKCLNENHTKLSAPCRMLLSKGF